MTRREQIKTVAIYDGWVKREYQPVHGRELYENDNHTQWLDAMPYAASLDALSPVYKKVMGELGATENNKWHRAGMLIFDLHVAAQNMEPAPIFTAIANAITFLTENKEK